MIESLTQEQLDRLPLYREMWIKRALTTERKSLAEAQIDLNRLQKLVLKMDPPAPVVLYDNPSKCWDAVNVVGKLKGLTHENVVERVTEALKTHDRTTNEPFKWPYLNCYDWAAWFARYEFFKNELGVKYGNLDEYEALKTCQCYCMVFPLPELCIVCQPPTVIKMNSKGLHCEDGPVISFNGENEIYALNGVISR